MIAASTHHAPEGRFLTVLQPSPDFWRNLRVAVTGGAGFVGGFVSQQLEDLGAVLRVVRSADFDLRHPDQARAAIEGSDVVMHLAANVGGIGYNSRNPAPLVYDNLAMAANVFEQSRQASVTKLVSACTVCAYPKFAPVPFRETDLWNGYPEETNAPYGLAKKMMVVLSDAYRRQYAFNSCVPVVINLYGPRDNFDLEDSHVIPALIRRFVEALETGAEQVTLWGTGVASREFLFVEDAARALLLAGEHLNTSEPVNIGTGVETRIRDLAEMIAELVGFSGAIDWDSSRPDGQLSRRLDVSRARALIGFEANVDLMSGLTTTVDAFRAQRAPVASA